MTFGELRVGLFFAHQDGRYLKCDPFHHEGRDVNAFSIAGGESMWFDDDEWIRPMTITMAFRLDPAPAYAQ